MLGTLLLAAALSTPRVCTPLITWSRSYGLFAAQDDYALYVRDWDGASTTSVIRIPKDGGAARTVATSKFLNIWAVDLDGPHVYFGTANREIFRRDFTSDELDVATGVEAAAYAVSSTEIRAIVPHVASSTFANVVAVHNPDGRCTGAYFAIE